VLVFLNKYFSGSTAAGPFPHPQFPFSGVHTWRIRALNVRCVNSLNQKTNKLNNPSAECRGFSASAVVALMAVLRNRGSISGKASQWKGGSTNDTSLPKRITAKKKKEMTL